MTFSNPASAVHAVRGTTVNLTAKRDITAATFENFFKMDIFEKLDVWIEGSSQIDLWKIIVSVIVIIVTLVLFILWRGRKSAGRSVLLTGLSDAGKTVLFAKLFHSESVQTYTSVKENISDIIVNDKNLQLIDIPGDERLRYKFFDKYKNSARGLVYVIDSVTLQKEIRDVAEFLYTLLSDPIMHGNTQVLILCNKQDQTMAKGVSVVQSLLEKEINLLRLTKSSQLEATDASSKNFFLGKQGQDFKFAHLSTKIDFAESSSSDIKQLNSWLQKVL